MQLKKKNIFYKNEKYNLNTIDIIENKLDLSERNIDDKEIENLSFFSPNWVLSSFIFISKSKHLSIISKFNKGVEFILCDIKIFNALNWWEFTFLINSKGISILKLRFELGNKLWYIFWLLI